MEATWGKTAIDQSAKWEFIFFVIIIFTPGLVVIRFLNCLNLHNLCLFYSAR